MAGGWEYFPAGMYDTLDETAKTAAARLAEDVSEVLTDENTLHEVQVAGTFWLTPAEQTVLHARVADLTVLGRAKDAQDPDKRLFASLLLDSGRPLIVVPPGCQGMNFKRIVVGWKPTRESARALHDAMDLLRRADNIDLVMVDELDRKESGLENEEADVMDYLAQHDMSVAFTRLPRSDGAAGRAILEFAERAQADLIVAGGYGRTRISEQLFGGVTRTLFETSRIPVLFSH
jgi:nucleotide-binding universal stress UspA family protein